MISPLEPNIRTTGPSGAIWRDFKRWLDGLAMAVSSTYVGDQSPGRSILIKSGQWGIHVKRLALVDNQRLVIEGGGRLVICG